MKKCYKLLLIIAISLYVPFFAISNVKADTTYQFDWTANEGGINGMFIDAGNSTINLSLYGVNLQRTCKSAIVIHYSFNSTYSGDFTLTFNNVIADFDPFPLSDSIDHFDYSTSSTNKKLTVYVNNATDISFVMISAVSSAQNWLIGYSSNLTEVSTDSDLSGILNAINTLGDYNIPLECLIAYDFAVQRSNPVVFNAGNYWPYIKVDSGDVTRNIRCQKNYFTNDFIFIGNVNLSLSDFTIIDNNVTVTLNRPYDFGNYSMYQLHFSTNSNTVITTNLRYNKTIYMYPIFYGDPRNMSETLKRMIGHTTVLDEIQNNTGWIGDTLDEILLLLSEDQSQADEDFITDMSDVVDDYSDSEVVIHDFFDNSMGDINLTDYSIPASLASTTAWVIDQMELIFYNAPDLRILMTLPLVLGIALFFIGRGSVIFRQGNIDRARETALNDEMIALNSVDKTNSTRYNMAEQKLMNNQSRMDHHHTSSRFHGGK